MTGMMSGDDLTKLDAAQGTDAAKLFLSQMIAHHEGAVEMANAEVRSGKNAEAVALAKDIAASQTRRNPGHEGPARPAVGGDRRSL